MKDIIIDEFQEKVDEVLIRHVSILDIISKLQQTSAKTNRAVIKAITSCGCIKINADKDIIPEDITYDEIKNFKHNHIEGELCQTCKEKIEAEIGSNLFYIAALSNALDINMYDIYLKEYKKLSTLGKFSLY
ncbi:MAG: DUF1573 domain-containing protein [Firmicutes bacterium]|jgi:hypothetical protein|nr:DUF1573 domain-containing protein [Bacillota bacterium]